MPPAKAYDLTKIRNLGVIAHIDAGKTTTTEHLLYYAGEKHRLGEVDKGTTETDYDPEEQQRGITIYSACVPFAWRDCTINLIDTPGHVDFTAEVERSLRVLDGAVVVFDAQKGVEAQSETVWRQANKYGVPRIVFVNKMDVVGANFANVLAEVRERLEGQPAPITIPIGAGSIKDSPEPFAGVIDLLAMEALYFDLPDGKTIRREAIPTHRASEAKHYRDQLFDLLTRHDEHDLITSVVLEGAEVDVVKVKQLIREQTIRRDIQPVLCGSGREHTGIQPLLDAVCEFLPSPIERPPVVGVNPKKGNKEESRKPDVDEPFCGLVFKVVAHPNGERFFVRVYSGTLKPQSRPFNPLRETKELAGKLYHVHSDPLKGLEEVPSAPAGDIVALVGLKDSVTGDTLCDAQHPIVLETIQFAEAVVSQSIEPESGADREKLTSALALLQREDPTFHVKIDKDTGQTLMSGMGMLHLEVKRHRMERDFRLTVRVGKPRVSYRETLREPRRVEGEFFKQAGGAGHFGKVTVQFSLEAGESPIAVVNQLPDGKLPLVLAAAAERGLRDALQSGGEFGYPVLNIKATMVDAVYDEQLSNEIAYVAAAADAVRKVFKDNVVLLEPIMHVEVALPEEALGPVTADLNARRAEILQLGPRGKWWVVEALAPLAKLFDYADKLRSLSQGRASSTMEPHSYRPAPDDVLKSFYDGTAYEVRTEVGDRLRTEVHRMSDISLCFCHIASILTAIAYLVKDILWLRILSVLACFSGIIYNAFALADSPIWAQIFWNGVFAAINIVQIALILRERAGVSFSDEEKELYETMFQSFAPFEFMKLLRVGKWREAKKDELLAVEDRPIDDVKLIYNGLVNVESKGEIVAQLRDGSFIGEISFLRGGDATATVRAERPTRYLSWSKEELNKLLNRNPSMRFAMQAVISTDLTKKLVR